MASTGMHADQIKPMPAEPFWPGMEAIAPMLAYDHAAIVGKDSSAPTGRAARVAVPALAMDGAASYLSWAKPRDAQPADTARGAAYLASQAHVVNPECSLLAAGRARPRRSGPRARFGLCVQDASPAYR